MDTLPFSHLSHSTRTTLLRNLADQFKDRYVIPDKGILLAQRLEQWATEEPEQDQEVTAWCKTLTQKLRQQVPDKHLNVFSRTGQQRRDHAAHQGIQKFEYLDGNVAYLDLRGFFGIEEAAPMLDAVMVLARPAKALVIDLRQNGGGSGDTVQYLCSHLLPGNTHLQTFHERGNRVQRQSWTLPHMPHRDTEKPVVILTSRSTGSAAEEFSYNLKALGRATLIGETTAGAAHTVDIVHLSEQVGAFIPTGHPLSPHTGAHWEGTGVEPDIQTDSNNALEVALKHLKSLP